MKKLLYFLSFFSVFYAISQPISLNDGWYFSKDSTLFSSDPVNLPHTWNNVDALDSERGYYMGSAWYSKDVLITSGQRNRVFLMFEGVNQIADVYVNGQLAGYHEGGYTAFVVDISPFVVLDTLNRVVVHVSNDTFNQEIPPMSGDFSFYGGIYRDVWLIRREASYFDLTDGSTKGVYYNAKADGSLQLTAKIKTEQSSDLELAFALFDDTGSKVVEKTFALKKKELPEFSFSVTIPNPKLWAPEEPNLYTVRLKLVDVKQNRVLDSYTGKAGFRTFAMNEKNQLVLNGKPLKLIGVNRHQDVEGLANALPDVLHYRDVKLLKEMGGNFLRTSHYPQDPAILEACDRLGIIVWEEIPLINFIMANTAFYSRIKKLLQVMIWQHYNHPSIAMWGLMNEILIGDKKALKRNNLDQDIYHQAVRNLTIELDSISKAEDPHRFTILAHYQKYEKHKDAGLLDITDIVGWNIYNGWYGEDPSKVESFVENFHRDFPHTGIIISEYGAGADPRLHSHKPERFDFSMEWQTYIHEEYLKTIQDKDYIMGGALWNLTDFGSENRTDAVPQINSKGILTYGREPKDSYLLYQAALRNDPFISIGSRHWREKAFITDTELVSDKIPIFTNCDSFLVEVNGDRLGIFESVGWVTDIPVLFREGYNAVSVASNSGQIAQADFHIQFIPNSLKSISASSIHIAMNLGSSIEINDPKMSQNWLPEKEYEPGSFGYLEGKRFKAGWRPGTGSSISGTTLDPLYQTARDSIRSFKADLPPGWYEITLYIAELTTTNARETMINELGMDNMEVNRNINREFWVHFNKQNPSIIIKNLIDRHAFPLKTKVWVGDDAGLEINFESIQLSPILSGIEIKGL